MGKKHYSGGGTLLGVGTVVRAKGRRGGSIGTSAAAIREQASVAEQERKRQSAKEIKANVKAARQLGKKWAQDQGRRVYEALVLKERVKSSPLAAALQTAVDRKDRAEG